MAGIIDLFEAHGVLAVFFGILVEQLGAPIPAVPFLLLAGGRSAADGTFALKALSAAVLACAVADTLWFLAGRRHGRSVLGLLCRVSLSPATCIRKSELGFARRGVLTILFAKFIPGVSTLTSPMAGALRMPLPTFLLLDLAGTVLWAGSALAAGRVFHAQVTALLDLLQHLGGTALPLVLGLLALYVAGRALHRFVVHRRMRAVPRVTPQELAAMAADGEPLVVLDVRSAGVAPHAGIPGALQTPLDAGLADRLRALDKAARIVAYCDCPNDASAARAAQVLARHGHRVRVLAGGLPAWTAAGLPVGQHDPHVPHGNGSRAQRTDRNAAPIRASQTFAASSDGCTGSPGAY